MAEGLLTHLERTPVDVDLAMRQWEAYVDALRAHGWETIEVPAADDCADAAFVEDTVLVYEGSAVISRPGAPERQPETAGTAEVLADLGYELGHIEEPGTLDGGDVLKIGQDVYVGLGGRTNQAGVDQLAHLLAPHGVRVRGVPITRVLHLKSAVTALPDGTVLVYAPLHEPTFPWDTVLEVPEEPGSHVVVLDQDTVLMATSAPRTQALLESRGLRTVTVDISEFERLEGCVTCLSVRLRPAT